MVGAVAPWHTVVVPLIVAVGMGFTTIEAVGVTAKPLVLVQPFTSAKEVIV